MKKRKSVGLLSKFGKALKSGKLPRGEYSSMQKGRNEGTVPYPEWYTGADKGGKKKWGYYAGLGCIGGYIILSVDLYGECVQNVAGG